MIQEAYVSFEVAKLLKEKGFDEKVLAVYIYDNLFVKGENKIVNAADVPIILAPTFQMAMAWLREEKNIIVNVWYNGVDYATEYFEPNTQTGVGKFVFIGDGYYAYEDAVEAALKYCLENLIK